MFIIFGTRRRVKKLHGRTLYHCNHCNNNEYWDIVQVAEWFTLFFIPIFPIQRQYYLMCPICSYGVKISSQEYKRLTGTSRENPYPNANQVDYYGKNEVQKNYLEQMRQVQENNNSIQNSDIH